jgi:hypothetical protein
MIQYLLKCHLKLRKHHVLESSTLLFEDFNEYLKIFIKHTRILIQHKANFHFKTHADFGSNSGKQCPFQLPYAVH